MTTEYYREIIGNYLHQSQSLQLHWQDLFLPEIHRLTANLTNGSQIHALGSHLTDIFFLARALGVRNHGGVSTAGYIWENLVLVYLNMALSGTNGIALKLNSNLCPSTFRMATSVWHGNTKTNKETDLAVAIFPTNMRFPAPGPNYIHDLDTEVQRRINDIEYGIIQCKTNWNENAQIAMLWDMIYQFRGNNFRNLHGAGVTIGEGQVSVNNFRGNCITYSFVTAPTQNTRFSPNSLPVQRVRNLSGGNYWGRPTAAGVARSLSEIFVSNFSYAFQGATVDQSINNAIGNNHLNWVRNI